MKNLTIKDMKLGRWDFGVLFLEFVSFFLCLNIISFCLRNASITDFIMLLGSP